MIKNNKKPLNYKFKRRCKNCGSFKSKLICPRCKNQKHKKNKMFRCGLCKKYIKKIDFPKDKSKKYGIMFCCKKCRKNKLNNGNN